MTLLEETRALIDKPKELRTLKDEERFIDLLGLCYLSLNTIFEQANAQFKCGDRHATFSKQTLNAINNSNNKPLSF